MELPLDLVETIRRTSQAWVEGERENYRMGVSSPSGDGCLMLRFTEVAGYELACLCVPQSYLSMVLFKGRKRQAPNI